MKTNHIQLQPPWVTMCKVLISTNAAATPPPWTVWLEAGWARWRHVTKETAMQINTSTSVWLEASGPFGSWFEDVTPRGKLFCGGKTHANKVHKYTTGSSQVCSGQFHVNIQVCRSQNHANLHEGSVTSETNVIWNNVKTENALTASFRTRHTNGSPPKWATTIKVS